jgi:hypothetical protein
LGLPFRRSWRKLAWYIFLVFLESSIRYARDLTAELLPDLNCFDFTMFDQALHRTR